MGGIVVGLPDNMGRDPRLNRRRRRRKRLATNRVAVRCSRRTRLASTRTHRPTTQTMRPLPARLFRQQRRIRNRGKRPVAQTHGRSVQRTLRCGTRASGMVAHAPRNVAQRQRIPVRVRRFNRRNSQPPPSTSKRCSDGKPVGRATEPRNMGTPRATEPDRLVSPSDPRSMFPASTGNPNTTTLNAARKYDEATRS